MHVQSTVHVISQGTREADSECIGLRVKHGTGTSGTYNSWTDATFISPHYRSLKQVNRTQVRSAHSISQVARTHSLASPREVVSNAYTSSTCLRCVDRNHAIARVLVIR